MLETSNYSIAKGSNSMNTYNTTHPELKISLSKKGVTWTDSRRAAYENSDKN
jgi:hypothetical protein